MRERDHLPDSRLLRSVREVFVVGIPAAGTLLPGGNQLGNGSALLGGVLTVLSGVLVVALLLVRRRAPLVVTSAMTVLYCADSDVLLGVLGALLSLAVRSSWRRTALGAGITVLGFAVAPSFSGAQVQPVWPAPASMLLAILAVVAAAGTGLYLGARRQLLAAAQERAERAEAEQGLLAERARARERARIAREMHDVLAHRLSMLSLHAGALEYRADVVGGEVARAAGVVRENSHEALQDLRDVLGVLRADSGPGPDRSRPQVGEGSAADADPTATGGAGLRPQPSLTQVAELVAEATAGAALVRMTLEGALDEVPAAAGRAGYRVVQEGLTNASKHAPGAEVAVRVVASDELLTVEVVNSRPPARRPATALPVLDGQGAGLIGVAERAELLGGDVEHGRTSAGGWFLRMVLPRRGEQQPGREADGDPDAVADRLPG